MSAHSIREPSEIEVIELKPLDGTEESQRIPYASIVTVASALGTEVAGVIQGSNRLIWAAIGMSVMSLITLKVES